MCVCITACLYYGILVFLAVCMTVCFYYCMIIFMSVCITVCLDYSMAVFLAVSVTVCLYYCMFLLMSDYITLCLHQFLFVLLYACFLAVCMTLCPITGHKVGPLYANCRSIILGFCVQVSTMLIPTQKVS